MPSRRIGNSVGEVLNDSHRHNMCVSVSHEESRFGNEVLAYPIYAQRVSHIAIGNQESVGQCANGVVESSSLRSPVATSAGNEITSSS